jgi:hypothetical protein
VGSKGAQEGRPELPERFGDGLHFPVVLEALLKVLAPTVDQFLALGALATVPQKAVVLLGLQVRPDALGAECVPSRPQLAGVTDNFTAYPATQVKIQIS